MNRREFISWVGVGSIAGSLPVAIAACSSPATKQMASPSQPDGFQVVGTVADLDKTGQLLNENLATGKALVIRDPAKDNKVIALNPICTHAGCTVAWKSNQEAFVCPCHGSKFATDGKVLHGPAAKPLTTYIAKLEGDLILIKAG